MTDNTSDDEPVSKQFHLQNEIQIESTTPNYSGTLRIREHGCEDSDPTAVEEAVEELFGIETQAELQLELPHLTASVELTPRTTRQTAHALAACAEDACHVEPLPTPETITQPPQLSTTKIPRSSDEDDKPPRLQTTAYPDRVRVELNAAEAAHVVDYPPTAARAFARQLLEAAADADTAEDYDPQRTGRIELTETSENPPS